MGLLVPFFSHLLFGQSSLGSVGSQQLEMTQKARSSSQAAKVSKRLWLPATLSLGRIRAPLLWKVLDVGLSASTKVRHVATRDPNEVTDAACGSR